MKKTAVYFLLILFVIQSTSNLWIISSFYINRDYIAKELCINRFDKMPVCKGICYLEKKISDNEKKEQKIPNVKEKEIQLYFYQQESIEFSKKSIVENSKMAIIQKDSNIKNTFLYSVFHPPKMA
ncbi:hypothetical protein RCH33_416 [Flavobacterium daejeonense]|nr:hypothetical protein RCH33_416 [Flavobacterium daejeonense]